MSEQPVGVVPQFTIGDRLRKARELTGLDQEQFAAAIDVSRGTVSNYENGSTTHLKQLVLKPWALYTGVPLQWLETGQIPEPGPGGTDGESDHILLGRQRLYQLSYVRDARESSLARAA